MSHHYVDECCNEQHHAERENEACMHEVPFLEALSPIKDLLRLWSAERCSRTGYRDVCAERATGEYSSSDDERD